MVFFRSFYFWRFERGVDICLLYCYGHIVNHYCMRFNRGVVRDFTLGYIVYLYLKVWQMSWFRFILLWLVILSTITFWGLQWSGSCYCGWLYCLLLPQGLADELAPVHITLVSYIVHHYCLGFYRGVILNVLNELIMKYYCLSFDRGVVWL